MVQCFRVPSRFVSAILLALLLPVLGAARERSQPQPPSILFAPLYQAVETAGIFSDQKSFADAVPNQPPAEILAEYEKRRHRPGFVLK
jgi:alpha,alpha-trehalase